MYEVEHYLTAFRSQKRRLMPGLKEVLHYSVSLGNKYFPVMWMHSCLSQPVSHLLYLSLLLADSFAEVSTLCVWGEQLQADGVIEAFGLLQLLLPLLHLRVGHPETIQQVPVLLLLWVNTEWSAGRWDVQSIRKTILFYNIEPSTAPDVNFSLAFVAISFSILDTSAM